MSEAIEQLSRGSFAGIIEKKQIEVKAPPLEVLPRDLREFVQVGAESLNCPTDFLFMPLLTTAGAAIGGSRAAVPKPGWREYPVLWNGIIAPPATGKSPALSLITSPIKDEQMRLVNEYERDMTRYKDEVREWSKNKKKAEKPDEPIQKLAFTTDCTTETFRDLLHERPNGVMLFQDELAGWIRSFNQYKTSGNDRQTWLSIWSAETVAAARKTSRVVLKRPIVPVLGGLQPDVLPVLTSEGRDGFLARLLLIYPDRVPLCYTFSTLPNTTKAVWARYYRDLSKMLGKLGVGLEEKEIIEMPFTESAARVLSDWLNDVHLKEIDGGELSPMLEDAWAKLRAYLVRIALILQGIWHVHGELKDRRIDDASVLNAIEVINYLKSHLRRSYDSLQVDPEEMLMQSILNWAKRKSEENDQFSFTPREIQQAKVLPSGINRSSRIKELLVSIRDHSYALVDDSYTLTIIV